MRYWGCVAVVVSLFGCGAEGDDQAVSIALTDHADVLTASGSDKLFGLKVTKSDESYALDKIMLTFKPAGGTATALNHELTVDANGDGRFSQGDTLTGVEPGADVLGTAQIGAQFNVELMEKLGPSQVLVLWSGDWTAN